MATLPDWTNVPAQQAQPSGAVASYQPNRGPDLSAGMNAGKELEQASAIIAESNQRQDMIFAQSKANALAQIRAQLQYDPKAGALAVKEGDAANPDFIKNYTTRFKDASQAIRDSLTSESQKRMFDRHAEVQGLQFQSTLLQHQARETEKFNDTTDNAKVKLAVDEIARNPDNTLTYSAKMADIEDTVNGLAKRKGMSPQATAELMATTKSSAIVARIQSIANGIPGVSEADPDTAMMLFKMEQPNLTKQALDQLSPELLRVGLATKAQTVGAQYANQFDYMHTGEAIKAIDATNMPPMLKIAVRTEVEHRHSVMQSNADKLNAVYIGKLDEMVQKGMSIAAIVATPEYGAVRDKGTVLKLVREKQEHSMNLQAAMESRDYTRVMRLRAEQTYKTMGDMFAYSDPMVLSGMSRPQVAALQLKLGVENTQHLLNRYDSITKSEAKLREAKMDDDQFKGIADSLGLHPFKATSEDDKRQLGTAKLRVEAAIDEWQQSHGNVEMPRPEKEKLMRQLIAAQVTTKGFIWNSNTNLLQVPEADVGSIVVPDVDKGQIITRLRQVTGKPDYQPTPEEIGRFYLRRKQSEAVNAR